MRSLAGVGARSLAHRKGRSALTAIGIVLGVAILFGVLVTNASVDRAFTNLVDRWRRPWVDAYARPVGTYDSSMPTSVAARVRELPDVRAIHASLGYSVTLRDVRPREARGQDDESPAVTMFLAGINFDEWRTWTRGDEKLGEGRWPTAMDEIVVSPSSNREHFAVGQAVAITSKAGDRTLKVVGRLAPRPKVAEDLNENEDGGGWTLVALPLVQELRGLGDVVDGISIDLNDDVNRALWVVRHGDELGAGVRVTEAFGGQDGFRPVLTTIQSSLTFVAAIALFVGAFLIYLTLSMAVVERTRLYGTLRALGATKRQVRRIVLSEAAVLGVLSTLAGLALGLGMSVLLVRALSSLLQLSRPGLVVTPVALVIAVVAGVVTTVVSAFVPARRAAGMPPVSAMRGDYDAGTRLGRAWIAGVVFAAIGAVLSVTLRGVGSMALSTFFILLGVVLLVPVILRPLARVLGRLTRRAEPGVGEVAVMHLVKERSRSAYTLALVMVVFAMVFSMAAANASMSRALDRGLDTQFGSDLRLFSPNGINPELMTALTSNPHVGKTTGAWFGSTHITAAEQKTATGTSVQSADPQLLIIDPATYFDVAGFVWTDGSSDETQEALERGGAVVLSESIAARIGVKRHDTITLTTAAGPKPFKITALYGGFGDQQPAVVGIGDGRTLFQAKEPAGLAVNIAEGDTTDPADVRKQLLATPAAKKYGLFIETVTAAKAEGQAQLGGFFRVFYAVLLVAAVVGLLGLTNTLAMSVLQRLREIGILRAIGTRRRQVRNMVVVEAATLVLVALLLALPLGWILSVLFVRSATDALGFSAPYVYPWAWVPGVGVLALLIGGLGAIAPARRASRLDVVTALAYE